MKTSLIAGKPKSLKDMVISSEASIEERSTTIENALYGEKPIEDVSRVHSSEWKWEGSYIW